jgi:myo-inositol-1(or 4)-monophosphatase
VPSSDLALAERLAREAGALLLERFGGPAQGIGSKSSETDLVSDADRAAEELIVAGLRAERADDGLVAEEGSASRSASGRQWVVDPLDGTVNFLYGIPQWAVSIALEDDGIAQAGVIHDPSHGETFAASRGEGATCNGHPIRVRDRDRLEVSLIATGFGYDPGRRARQAEIVSRVLPRARDIRRAGAAALDLAWVACGRLDGFYERGINHWDWAAGRLIVEEAGGVVVDLEGDPAGLIAAGPSLVPQLQELVAAW